MAEMKEKIHLVIHKKSCAREEVKQAVKKIRKQGIDISVYIPWNKKELRKFIRDRIKNGVERIISGGGDGTLNAVVNSMIFKNRNHQTSLGIWPLGTANDFARGCNIPLDDLESALLLACTGNASNIDVGCVNGLHFINVASGGYGAEITASTPQELKRLLGGAAYTLLGLVKAFEFQPYGCRVVSKSCTTEKMSVVALAVGNNRYAGGGFDVAPKRSLTDGLLDIAILTDIRNVQTNDVVAEITDPFNKNNKNFYYRQLSNFVIEADRPLHINLDGEPIIDSHFEFSVLPKILAVVMN